jgi:hypothetical protein
MKQALLASARRIPDANIFEQGGLMSASIGTGLWLDQDQS